MTTMTSAPAAASTSITEYEPVAVQRLVQEQKARLIDVRELDEHRRERIDPSTSVPSATVSRESVGEVPGRTTILYCRSGRRSAAAAEKLAAAGAAVAHMKGGIEGWKAAGLPVVTDRKAPMTTMQQTQALMGSIVVVCTALGAFVTPWALIGAAFVGCGMVFAGLTGSCAMNDLLAKAPWNRANTCGGGCNVGR